MWLVDLRGQRLVRHRAPRQGSYTIIDEPDRGVPIELSALPGVAVELQSLFGT
jgi:hypothetical protein